MKKEKIIIWILDTMAIPCFLLFGAIIYNVMSNDFLFYRGITFVVGAYILGMASAGLIYLNRDRK